MLLVTYENPGVLRALQKKIAASNAAAEMNRQRYLERQRSIVSSANALNKGSGLTTLSSQQSVQVDVGVLLVEFTGRPHYTDALHPNGYTVSNFETMLFSNNQYNNVSPDNEVVFGSLRDYFEFQSHGILTITGQIINPSVRGIPTWLNMGSSAPYNTLGESDNLLQDAITRAVVPIRVGTVITMSSLFSSLKMTGPGTKQEWPGFKVLFHPITFHPLLILQTGLVVMFSTSAMPRNTGTPTKRHSVTSVSIATNCFTCLVGEFQIY